VPSDRVGAPLDALSPDAPSTRVPTSNGVVNVPGTGFLNGAGRQNISEQAGDVIHLWREPFNRHGTPACSLPHASGVLVLESQTGSAGSNAFKVENRGCIGWVDGSDLSVTRPTPLGPSSNTKGEEPPK
jgi:hypothetical protein